MTKRFDASLMIDGDNTYLAVDSWLKARSRPEVM
jgi:hypothetical protein